MDYRGGCCIARYAGGGGACDMSKVERVMLRFRPIAPKPASSGSVSPPQAEVYSKSGRGKRKYSKENNNNNSSNSGSVSSNGNSKRCNKKRREEKEGSGQVEVVTLPLLPETPEGKAPAKVFGSTVQQKQNTATCWLSFGDGGAYQTVVEPPDLTDITTARTAAVVSCVTVECITDTWMGAEYGLGSTDEEKRMNLERDTCPGLISNGLGRVTWTNRAYREKVGQGDEKMMVRLVMRERPMLTRDAFTCRVKLQYACREKERSGITLPCDVWRMNDGGFAWRLDTNAALCLGRC